MFFSVENDLKEPPTQKLKQNYGLNTPLTTEIQWCLHKGIFSIAFHFDKLY